MSENVNYQLQQLTNEELINFALEDLGQEHEAIRKAALQELFLRVKDSPNTLTAPARDVHVLRSKLVQLQDQSNPSLP